MEPSAWDTAEAQRHGLNVIEGTQDAPQLAGKQFDALTMWDVIEHVADPSAELKKAHALLKQEAALYRRAYHECGQPDGQIDGRQLVVIHAYTHPYFSEHTLSAMMRRDGFEIVWVGCAAVTCVSTISSLALAISSPRLGRLARRVVDGLGVADKAVPVNFGDLFAVYGRKRGN